MKKLISHEYVEDIFERKARNSDFQMFIYSQVFYEKFPTKALQSSDVISGEYVTRLISADNEVDCAYIQQVLIENLNQQIFQTEPQKMKFYAANSCEVQEP